MEPSARAFAAVRKLTRQALQDGWLEPCVDGLPVGTAGDVAHGTPGGMGTDRPLGTAVRQTDQRDCRPARAAIRPDELRNPIPLPV